MGGSKWDSSKGLLFCFNDLLFHLVLKIRMEDLSRYFFFRRCTCWQSIPWVMIFNVLHHLQLSYWIFLFIIIMEFFIYLKNIFLQRCHTDVVHLVSVEREKKRNERKNKKWISRDQCQRFDQQHVSNLSLILTLCDLKYKWWVVHFSFNIKTSVGQFISQCLPIQFFFLFLSSIFSLSDLPDLYFNYRLPISNHWGNRKKASIQFLSLYNA